MATQSKRRKQATPLRTVESDNARVEKIPRTVSSRAWKLAFAAAVLFGGVGYAWYLACVPAAPHGMIFGVIPANWLALGFFILVYGPLLLLAFVTVLDEIIAVFTATRKLCGFIAHQLNIRNWFGHIL